MVVGGAEPEAGVAEGGTGTHVSIGIDSETETMMAALGVTTPCHCTVHMLPVASCDLPFDAGDRRQRQFQHGRGRDKEEVEVCLQILDEWCQ